MLSIRQNKAEKNVETERDKLIISALNAFPDRYWDFLDDDTREYTHGFHSYPAMMVCPISRSILRMMKEIMPIHAVLDPFSGSGTVLAEGMLAGIACVDGNDINPLAILLSKVKTTPIATSKLQSTCKELVDSIDKRYAHYSSEIDSADDILSNEFGIDLTAKDGWGENAPQYLSEYCEKKGISMHIPSFKNIGYWFKPRTILLLQIIKDEIMNIDDEQIKDFAFVAFSESIRLVSNRRNGEFKMFRMPPAKVAAFVPNVLGEFEQILFRNIGKMDSFVTAYAETKAVTTVSVYRDNATDLGHIEDGFYDLIVTSPPYGDSRTTVAYGQYSRLSLQWLGLENLSDKEIMSLDQKLMGGRKYRKGFEYLLNSDTLKGSLERIQDVDIERAGDVYSFYDDLAASIQAVSRKTRIGGYQFWVVGNRKVKNELLLTDVIISELAADRGLDFVCSIDRRISNKVMPSKNSPTNETGKKEGTMMNEHIVVLRKVK